MYTLLFYYITVFVLPTKVFCELMRQSHYNFTLVVNFIQTWEFRNLIPSEIQSSSLRHLSEVFTTIKLKYGSVSIYVCFHSN